jgi:hypothetical protein
MKENSGIPRPTRRLGIAGPPVRPAHSFDHGITPVSSSAIIVVVTFLLAKVQEWKIVWPPKNALSESIPLNIQHIKVKYNKLKFFCSPARVFCGTAVCLARDALCVFYASPG